MPARTDIPLPPRYRDPVLLAHGGMADVYRATDQELGREVAVKVLAPRFADDESLRRRFHHESLAAARLSGNPSIVTIYDVAEQDGRPLIVMELLLGGSLAERTADGRGIPPAQVLDWLDEAGAALDAAHAAGIVHRDVKPGNLLLDEHGHVKVADFGIASAVGLDSFTQAGTVLGTAGYLSPEQARGERASAASDRYGLAVVAWELLVGARPFAADTPAAEATAHVRAPVPQITGVSPSLPRAFDAIFERALAKEPERRFATSAEFVGALRRALHDDAGDTWIEPVPTRRAPAPAAPVHVRRRGSVVVAAALAALAAVGAVVAFLATRGGSSDAGGRTVVRTVTGPGTTVQRTITQQPPATAPSTTPSTTASTSPSTGTSGAALDLAGYRRMQAGDYTGALPLLEQAVAKLQGTGSLDEAYADYNLAYTRRALGTCTGVLDLLDRSQQVQGHRKEIDRLRRDARKQC